jgi:hypothetical protein
MFLESWRLATRFCPLIGSTVGWVPPPPQVPIEKPSLFALRLGAFVSGFCIPTSSSVAVGGRLERGQAGGHGNAGNDRAGGRMTYQILAEDGHGMDAHVEVDPTGITFHSRGGSSARGTVKNADYGPALRLVVHRIAAA